MTQPIKNKSIKTLKKKSHQTVSKKGRKHKEYGTSKLEERFAKEFLDKLGVKYEYQFKAEEIGRYYDFRITTPMGSSILIEVDGDFWHGKDLVYEEKNRMQKHSEYVDKLKDEWALVHGIPIIRIWESDINNNPGKVMKMLKDALYIQDKKDDMKKRH